MAKTATKTPTYTTFLHFQAAYPEQARHLTHLTRAQRAGLAPLHPEDAAFLEQTVLADLNDDDDDDDD